MPFRYLLVSAGSPSAWPIKPTTYWLLVTRTKFSYTRSSVGVTLIIKAQWQDEAVMLHRREIGLPATLSWPQPIYLHSSLPFLSPINRRLTSTTQISSSYPTQAQPSTIPLTTLSNSSPCTPSNSFDISSYSV